MRRFYLILFIYVAVLGCGQEQQLLKPVMMTVGDEPASEEVHTPPEMPVKEEPRLEIPFDLSDVEVPPKSSVPADVEVLETDEVFHFTAAGFAEEQQNWLGTFDTAGEAIHAEPVVDFFESVKASVANCDSGNVSFLPEAYLLFTNRAARERFKQALPGGFITTVDEYPPKSDKRWKKWWEITAEPVVIVDAKDTYFGVGVYPNDPCNNFR